jgi:cysteine-rich repeat protein
MRLRLGFSVLRHDILAHRLLAGAVALGGALAASNASAAPGDLLIAVGSEVHDFEAGGDLTMAAPFATLGGEIVSFCMGPGHHLYVGINGGGIYDITAGGDFSAAQPFASLPGTPISLACNATTVRALVNTSVYDATGGGANLFAFDLQNGIEIMYGVGGHLFAVRYDGVVDIHSGGSLAAKPFHVASSGDFFVAGSSDGDTMIVSGLLTGIHDVTLAGPLGAAIVTGLDQATDVIVSPKGTYAWDSLQAAIFDITAGGDMSNATPHATAYSTTWGAMVYVTGCGDGFEQPDEACDGDGAGVGGESATCNDDCTLADCGDDKVNQAAGEACDDGAETAACDDDCTLASCGDGHENTAAGEACDDGNTTPGDGCDASCSIEEGGAGGAGGTGDGGAGGTVDRGGAGGAGGSAENGGSPSSETVCTPGQQIACACPGGAPGAQACSTDGSGYASCSCPPPSELPLEPEDGCSVTERRSSPLSWLAAVAAALVASLRRRRAQRVAR